MDFKTNPAAAKELLLSLCDLGNFLNVVRGHGPVTVPTELVHQFQETVRNFSQLSESVFVEVPSPKKRKRTVIFDDFRQGGRRYGHRNRY